MTAPDPVLEDFLSEVRTLADTTAPAPSDELEALFSSPLPLAQRGRPEPAPLHPARRLLTSLAIAAAVVALLVTAAATHELPAPAQRLISKVVNAITPFHIDPDPPHPSPAGPGRAPSPAHSAHPVGHRTPAPTSPPRRATSPVPRTSPVATRATPTTSGSDAPSPATPARSAAPTAGHRSGARSHGAPASASASGHGAGRRHNHPVHPTTPVGGTRADGGGRPASSSPVPSPASPTLPAAASPSARHPAPSRSAGRHLPRSVDQASTASRKALPNRRPGS